MNRIYKLIALSVAIGSFLLISCVSNKHESGKTKVIRSLVSAKAFTHPEKIDAKEDMEFCRNAVPRENFDNCMSEKGWIIKTKKYD